MFVYLKKFFDLFDIHYFLYISSKTYRIFIILYLYWIMWYDMPLWEIEIHIYIRPYHDICLTSVFEYWSNREYVLCNIAFCLYNTCIMPYAQNQLLLICIRVLQGHLWLTKVLQQGLIDGKLPNTRSHSTTSSQYTL